MTGTQQVLFSNLSSMVDAVGVSINWFLCHEILQNLGCPQMFKQTHGDWRPYQVELGWSELLGALPPNTTRQNDLRQHSLNMFKRSLKNAKNPTKPITMCIDVCICRSIVKSSFSGGTVLVCPPPEAPAPYPVLVPRAVAA